MEKITDFWWRDEGQEFSKIVKASAPLSTKAPTLLLGGCLFQFNGSDHSDS